ncbi:MAG: hypothetical protein ACLFV8_09265 [Alphaproteobacteria bacterium]
MFGTMLRIVNGLAVLLALTAAPAAHAQICKVHIKFTCAGNGNGTLSVSCRPGESAGACCERQGRDIRRLCNRVGNGLASQQCNYLGTSAGVCAGSGGTSGNTTASQADTDIDTEVRGSRAPGMLSRPCPRVSYRYRCKTGDRGSSGANCKRGEDTSTCCRRALAWRCGHAGFVEWNKSVCKCLSPPALKRRR